jgi:hypothetical protein
MKTNRLTTRLLPLLAAFALLGSAHAQTAVPDFLSYQGRALNADGTAIGAGTPVNRTITFRVWDHPSNGLAANLIYSEQQVVTIANGEFSSLIGAGAATTGTPLGYSESTKGVPTVKISTPSVFGAATRYLGVTIDDGTAAVDNEISPRQQFVTSSYAFRAKVAESVDANAISSAMLATGAVGSTQLAAAAVTNAKLGTDAVLTTNIGNLNVTTAKLADLNVTTAKIADANVTTAKIADANVTTAKIADLNVTTGKLANASVTGTKIALATIAAANLATGAVTSTGILDGTIATADMADSAVTTAKLADNSVVTADLADNSVTSAKIASGVNLSAGTLAATGNATIGSVGGTATLKVNDKPVPVAEENLRMVRGSISQTSTTGVKILLHNITTLTPVTRGTGWSLNGTTAIADSNGTGYFRKVVFNPPFSDTPTITAATHVNYSDQNPSSTHNPNFRNVTKDGFEVSMAAGYYYQTTWYFQYYGYLPVDFIAIGPR